jgi:hypothetical protein
MRRWRSVVLIVYPLALVIVILDVKDWAVTPSITQSMGIISSYKRKSIMAQSYYNEFIRPAISSVTFMVLQT